MTPARQPSAARSRCYRGGFSGPSTGFGAPGGFGGPPPKAVDPSSGRKRFTLAILILGELR
jgi:hypothetical protein